MGESGLWFGVEGSSASSPAHSGAAPQPVKLFFMSLSQKMKRLMSVGNKKVSASGGWAQ